MRWHSSEVPHFCETNPILDAEIMCHIAEKLHIFSTGKKIFIWVLPESSLENYVLLEESLYRKDYE